MTGGEVHGVGRQDAGHTLTPERDPNGTGLDDMAAPVSRVVGFAGDQEDLGIRMRP
jgi:hypothetical protein